MAIKGLTDRGQDGSLPTIGKLRKGAKKTGNAPGKDLTGFRFDSSDRAAIDRFQSVYGDEPQVINCLLPFPTVDECFFTAKESYVASGLRSRCDGENISALRTGQTIQRQWAGDQPKCAAMPDGFCKECKNVGRLKLIIPELARFAYVEVETHAINDIINLYDQLQAVQFTFGRLNAIPFVLKRSPKMISTPRGDSRARVEKWLLSIEISPEWASLQLDAAKSAQLQAANVYSIGGTVEPAIAQLPAAPTTPKQIELPTIRANYRESDVWLQFQSDVATAIRSADHAYADSIVRQAYQAVNTGLLPKEARSGIEMEERRIASAIASADGQPSNLNLVRLAELRSLTGHTKAQCKVIVLAVGLEKQNAEDWTAEECDRFRDAMMLDYGSRFDCWKDNDQKANSYLAILESFESDPSDRMLFEVWNAELQARTSQIEVAAEAV